MDIKNEFTLAFEGLDGPQANVAAESLKDALASLGKSDISVTIRKERADTQDFGASLILVFGTPVAITVARGIADWIRARPDTTVCVSDKNGRKVLDFSGKGKDLDKLKGLLQGR